MVVVAIVVILAAVSIPAIMSLTKNNAQAQAVNQIRAMLSYARSIAVSQQRRAGVVFINETLQFSSPVNSSQTAMQIFVEDYNQAPYYSAGQNVATIGFTYLSADRQYLPPGIRIGTISQGSGGAESLNTGDNGTTAQQKVRAILFDGNGQMIIQNSMATANPTGSPGTYPMAFGDWQFTNPANTGAANNMVNATSAPAIMVFNQNDYLQQGFPNTAAGDILRTAWIEQHADVLVINPYTGSPIR